MGSSYFKKTLALFILFVVIIIGIFFYVSWQNNNVASEKAKQALLELQKNSPKIETVGKSVQDRKIESYTFGKGEKNLLFVGGIHGGYEWNTIVLAYKFIDFLSVNPKIIPANLKVTIIPSLNPDGTYKVIGKEGRFNIADVGTTTEGTKIGRFNANEVDLNRNFDCKWKSTSTWQEKIVNAGTKPFSEPEAKAIQDFILKNMPAAVIFWHSQSGTVYTSECKNGILPDTNKIMNIYTEASGYSKARAFNSYEITGDAGDWLASINIPSITVELKTHQTIEWEQNLAGMKALFEYYKN